MKFPVFSLLFCAYTGEHDMCFQEPAPRNIVTLCCSALPSHHAPVCQRVGIGAILSGSRTLQMSPPLANILLTCIWIISHFCLLRTMLL